MTAVIYSNGSQECQRIAAFEAEFGEEATYPQVSIGAKHLGNLHDTLHYMSDKGMFV
jgi:hypothetical protein